MKYVYTYTYMYMYMYMYIAVYIAVYIAMYIAMYIVVYLIMYNVLYIYTHMHAASIFIHRHTSQPHDISISGGSSQNAKILQSNWPLGPLAPWTK